MSTKKTGFLSKAFVIAAIMMLGMNTSAQMLNSTLSPFANYMWGTKTMGGLLTSFFNVGSICMAFLAGLLIQKAGKKRALFIFSIIFALAILMLPLCPMKGVALIARTLQGMSKGVIAVGTASIVAEVVPAERMSQGMGIYGMGTALSMAVGPIIALNLVGDNNRYTQMFIVCMLIVGSSAFCALGLHYKPVGAGEKAASVENKKTLSTWQQDGKAQYRGVWMFIERRALLPSLIYTILFASLSNVLVFLSIYAQEILHYNSASIPYFFTVTAIVMLFVRGFSGGIADRKGELYVLIPSCIGIIVMQLLLAFCCQGSAGYLVFLICGGLFGMGLATGSPVMNAIAVTDSPKERSSVANATFYFLYDTGILVASTLFGRIIDAAATPAAGYKITFLIAAAVCALSMVLMIIFMNRKARARRLRRYERNGA